VRSLMNFGASGHRYYARFVHVHDGIRMLMKGFIRDYQILMTMMTMSLHLMQII
jgi:hypothetical protein